MTKYRKVVWYECPNCKNVVELPGPVFHDEFGIPVCGKCGKHLVRRVRKVKKEDTLPPPKVFLEGTEKSV